jgi:hypothetical protein
MNDTDRLFPVWLHGVDALGNPKVVTLIASPGTFMVRMFPESIRALEDEHAMTLMAIYTDRPDSLCWLRPIPIEDANMFQPEPEPEPDLTALIEKFDETANLVREFGEKINAAYAEIAKARREAGVAPGEPLLNLNLDEGECER